MLLAKPAPIRRRKVAKSVVSALILAAFTSFLGTTATARTMPVWQDTALVGAVDRVYAKYEDTLAAIGDRHSLGYLELLFANPGVDPWLPGEETPIILPSRFILPAGAREGIVINLAEFRLYHYKDNSVTTYPVGVGRSTAPSPLTHTEVTMRLESPAWYPPESVRQEHAAEGDQLPRVIPPGPDNPLGPFALQLAEKGYLIHGTNKRFGIGMQVSHGCIRMYNQDISELVWRVETGTPVRIVDQPVKFGVQDRVLWIEVHRKQDEQTREQTNRLWQAASESLQAVEREHPGLELNRALMEKAIEQADGIPRRVGEVIPTQVAREDSRRPSGDAEGS